MDSKQREKILYQDYELFDPETKLVKFKVRRLGCGLDSKKKREMQKIVENIIDHYLVDEAKRFGSFREKIKRVR